MFSTKKLNDSTQVLNLEKTDHVFALLQLYY